jgi:hypothetical protein
MSETDDSQPPSPPADEPPPRVKQDRVAIAKFHPAFVANHGRIKKGTVLNPSGKPKALPRFRKACREDSFLILQEIRRRIREDATENAIPLGELIKAFAELTDRGGFTKPKDDQELENAKIRLLTTALALDGLTDEQRKKLLAVINGE